MENNQSHFPCERCGSDLVYSPEHQSLQCDHCGFKNEIPVIFEPIKEYDLQQALHDLDRLKRVVKLTGFVNSTPDFGDQPKVINGASDFLVEALGDKGRHSRSAVSAASLPFGVAVEIEGVMVLED